MKVTAEIGNRVAADLDSSGLLPGGVDPEVGAGAATRKSRVVETN